MVDLKNLMMVLGSTTGRAFENALVQANDDQDYM